MELQIERIVTLNRVHESVDRRIGRILGFEAFEKEVPEDEDAAVIFVNVLRISRCKSEEKHNDSHAHVSEDPYRDARDDGWEC